VRVEFSDGGLEDVPIAAVQSASMFVGQNPEMQTVKR
jgi:hypothetical protein